MKAIDMRVPDRNRVGATDYTGGGYALTSA